jgi:hypothetical protein
MKRIIFLTLFLIGILHKPVSAGTYDSAAVMILDRMSDLIGSLQSCRFQLAVANDQGNSKGELVKYFTDYDISFSGASNLLIDAKGYHGHRQIRYNGKQFAYYSFTENNYGMLDVPDKTIQMMDSMNKKYGIDFPAADFFYPGFTDDMIEHTDSIILLEPVREGEKEYFQIMAYAKDFNVQFWIENGAYTLPARFCITYKNKAGNPQYMGIFSDWQLNINLPPTLFDFVPPPGARKVRIMSKSGV